MSNWRAFLRGAIAAAFRDPLAIAAQQARRIARLGILLLGALFASDLPAAETGFARSGGGKLFRLGVLSLNDPFRRAEAPVPGILPAVTLPELAKRGFVEGHNLSVEARFGLPHTLPDLARDLVGTEPDVIIALGMPAARAAASITDTVPIVMMAAGDPVREGLAASLPRPGRNITGVVSIPEELDGKRLQLLIEAVPTVRHVAALVRPGATDEAGLRAMRAVAVSIGVEIVAFRAAGPDDYPAAFAAIRDAGAQALAVAPAGVFDRDAALLARLAIEAGLPTVCPFAVFARHGCLLGYGANPLELRRRVADFVVRIL
jgi:putative ABC transport system substrate-binding protein